MNEIEYIYNIITLCLTLLFSFYLFFKSSQERIGNVFLGLFLFYMGLESIDTLLAQTSFYFDNPNFYLHIPILGLLLYPIFFFYIKSISYRRIKLKWYHLLHATPYLIIVIISIFEYYLKPTDVQLKIMTRGGEMPWFVSLIYLVLRLQGVIYMILTIRIALRFKQIVKENYSSVNKRNYKWLLQLTLVFIYYAFANLLFNINRFGINLLSTDATFYISALISLTFIIWIFYKGLSQPYLFNGVDANMQLLKEYIAEQKKIIKPSNTEEENLTNQKLKLKLENYITSQEIYLNPSLTIFELAKGLELTSHELSLFLNKYLKKNFFDYINEFRINRAKSILKNPEKRHLTILEILYEVGFNSKSSFNTAFKKYVGTTPTEYRKAHKH